MEYIDLHVHSTASDGTYTPEALVKLGKKTGLSAMALTDHDTVDGIADFLAACEKEGIEGIPGVEISAKFRTEMHILGLFVNYRDEEFRKKLNKLKNARKDRNLKIYEKLRADGFDINESDITGQKKNGGLENTGRAHIAAALVKKGYVTSIQEAFDKYISKGKPYYVPRTTYPPKESIEMIKSAGGIAILAHPIFITKDYSELKQILLQLKEYGLSGMECYYSEYTPEYTRLCTELCGELKLAASGGSDFHGDNKEHIQLGKVCGGGIDYKLLSVLKGLR